MYATREDIEALYGADELRGVLDLARDEPLTGEHTARIDKALTECASQIDAYLGTRFVLPLSVVPDVLSSFAIDMAMYRLALRNGRPRDELRTRYDDAIKFLRSVAEGKASLPGVGTDGSPDSDASFGSNADVQFVSRDRTFNRKTGLLT